jgi:hypothetical protein
MKGPFRQHPEVRRDFANILFFHNNAKKGKKFSLLGIASCAACPFF